MKRVQSLVKRNWGIVKLVSQTEMHTCMPQFLSTGLLLHTTIILWPIYARSIVRKICLTVSIYTGDLQFSLLQLTVRLKLVKQRRNFSISLYFKPESCQSHGCGEMHGKVSKRVDLFRKTERNNRIILSFIGFLSQRNIFNWKTVKYTCTWLKLNIMNLTADHYHNSFSNPCQFVWKPLFNLKH